MFSKHAKIDRIIDPILVTSACACVLCVLCVLCVCCVCVCVCVCILPPLEESNTQPNRKITTVTQAQGLIP